MRLSALTLIVLAVTACSSTKLSDSSASHAPKSSPTATAIPGKTTAQKLGAVVTVAVREINAEEDIFKASKRTLTDWHLVGQSAADSYLRFLHDLAHIDFSAHDTEYGALVKDSIVMRQLLNEIAHAQSVDEASGLSVEANGRATAVSIDLYALEEAVGH